MSENICDKCGAEVSNGRCTRGERCGLSEKPDEPDANEGLPDLADIFPWLKRQDQIGDCP